MDFYCSDETNLWKDYLLIAINGSKVSGSVKFKRSIGMEEKAIKRK